MTEPDDHALARTWLMNQRAGLVGAAILAISALAVIQATDRASDRLTVLVVVLLAAIAGGLVGYVIAASVRGVRGGRVRRPGSMVRFVAMLGVAALLALVTSLVNRWLGLSFQNPGATFVAICPLLALLAIEIAYGIPIRMGDL